MVSSGLMTFVSPLISDRRCLRKISGSATEERERGPRVDSTVRI